MTSIDASASTSIQMPEAGTVDMKLEVVTLPVSDVDRAKRFYQSLGWRLDADIVRGEAFRAVQLTPPHSGCSVAFGKGLTTDEPGSVQRLLLAVYDVDAARADLISRGVEVSEVFHLAGGRVPGPDPEGRSYQTYASFSDPDGNGWLLQEIKKRLPGREWEDPTTDVSTLAGLLHETAQHHDPYEKSHAPHNWWDWYAAYFHAREQGRTPGEASQAAGRYMDEILHVAALLWVRDRRSMYARTEDLDKATTWATREAQYDAVCTWGIPDHGLLQRLGAIDMPVFVVNGDSDPMILPRYPYLLAGLIPHAEVIIYPDSAHGFLFQHHAEFAADVEAFLAASARLPVTAVPACGPPSRPAPP